MPLFRDIARPAPGATVEAYLDWAARRDPIGHKVHLALAVLALVMIPLSSSAASIGSTPLLIYTLMRMPTIHYTWRALARNYAFLGLCLLFLWLGISLIWSEDPRHGLRLLRSARYLLLVPALIPLMRHTGVLCAAICTGVFIQNAVQVSMWLTIPRYFGGGLEHHPGTAGIWFIFAIGILLTFPVSMNRARIGLRLSALLPMFGVVITAARSVLLGGVVALVFLTGRAIVSRGSRIKTTMILALALLGIALSVPFASKTIMEERLGAALSAMNETDQDGSIDMTSKENIRFLWWSIGFNQWMDSWMVGDGLGSTEIRIHSDPRVLEAMDRDPENDYVLRDDYHSAFVTAAAEGGIIGLVILCSLLVILGFQIRGGGDLANALAVGFIGFVCFAIFNTSLFSGRVLCLPLVLMALSTRIHPRSVSVDWKMKDEETCSERE